MILEGGLREGDTAAVSRGADGLALAAAPREMAA